MPRPNRIPVARGPSRYPPSPITPANFLALAPHPNTPAPPAPRRPTLGPPPAGWTRTLHAVPAAYPRQLMQGTGDLGRSSEPFGNTRPIPGESKAVRKARVESAVGAAVLARVDAYEWSLEEALRVKPDGLFLGVERWTRDKPVGGHTLVCTHPNGTQKEHWHPTLRRILASDAPARAFGTAEPLPAGPVLIDDIWLIDHYNHGVSVDLNDGHMGCADIWDDVGRDVLNFIVHVLPSAKQSAPKDLPWQLLWRPEGLAPAVKVMGMGGSYGGTGHVMAAHSRPDVYHGVFLADTLIQPRALNRSAVLPTEEQDVGTNLARAAMKRRDAWPSRVEAGRTWRKNPFYATWHPEVFELTLSHGLVRANPYGVEEGDPNVDDAPVVLATPTWAEASVFVEPMSSGRAWDMLPNLKVPVAFLVAENRFPVDLNREVVWRAPLARNEKLVGIGHMCLQENPQAVSEAAVRFLQTLAAGKWGSKDEIRAEYDALAAKL
ncbi:uncharacterized protein CcaverHIS019_0502130 [Cutaneotrichosporon cavernicola]|uniref:Alpha/beta-hydrolase n=1 Tax=Cutaneotrichosporon cavernicola TaxID=279322 RepID=A0AA48L619_9TREE|nr:uncharacterized protein CcaverHIS019_0502130 [Cutaneotrichosporon cavernicola]BEI92585.1 hypothetical protein CcaverHIS019_0502130 [Cutaneotrichosporon cavernicola]BEJ00360.1 hypothetical protein CcaverHIS631_0502170 [Cutaneotrichosporon cavernicola]BEJ08130.1 hypothetical protein CcaverHIS641_0502150 [Cutaneotrichosporon cavernicola]